MDWLVPFDSVTEDDYTRAVAEKADTLLRSSQFIDLQKMDADVEIRVWVEAACGPACVSVTWEPGVQRYGFHLLDESLRERLACVVFDAIPCVDAQGSLSQSDAILDAALRSVLAAEKHADATKLAERIRDAHESVRVPVMEGPAPDTGVER